MGKVVEKKKKKGRPSLLDLQKRNLKQQQEEELRNQQLLQPQLRRSHKFQNPNPNDNNNSHTPARRSTRRNTNLDADEDEGAADDDGDQSTRIRRREKKLKLVSKLPDSSVNSGSFNSGSDSNPEDDNDATASHKKRKIESIGDRSGQRKDDKVSEQQGRGSANPTSTTQDTRLDDGPSTPLPDKKLLLFILDRLQKKDTYGVFADPVDPEELPDYHEVVKNPIDFSTIRKKLVNRAYADLEQFEKDVFLLCSNAMQYNAPDTIYFRQARSIQELAKKNFENLRQDSDDNEPEPEPEMKIVRRGRPPTKNLKRPVGRPSLERSVSGSPGATLATGGETSTRLNNDVRRANGLDKYASPDPFGRINYGSRQGDAYISWSADKYDRTDEIFGSMAKGISMKHGKKPIIVDENRRNTYSESCSSAGVRDPSSAMTTFRLQDKHLVPVGLHTEHGYARSLVRFAAKLGPVAWKVATKKIERCLPPGVKFGPGWVGENDSSSLTSVHPSTSSAAPPLMSESNGSRSSDREGSDSLQKQVPSNQSLPDNRQSKTILPVRKSSPGSCSGAAEAVQTCNPQPPFSTLNNSGTSATRPTPSFPVHQQSMLQPRVNGVNGAYDFTFPTHMGKLIRSAGIWPHQSATENDSEDTKLSVNLNPEKRVDCLSDSAAQQKPVQSDPLMVGSGPPDLNVGFQSPGSPSGKAESGQPELALQL